MEGRLSQTQPEVIYYTSNAHTPPQPPLPLCLRSALTTRRVVFLSVKAPSCFSSGLPSIYISLFPSVPCVSAMEVCFGLGPCLLLWCMTSLRDIMHGSVNH